MRFLVKATWRYIWPLPYSLLGLLLALAIRLIHGRWRFKLGVLEVYGPAAEWLLAWHPVGGVVACALGHVIVARDSDTMRQTAAHERAHVRQFETWGLLFPLIYAGASLYAWLRSRHYYADNCFERAAEDAARRNTLN